MTTVVYRSRDSGALDTRYPRPLYAGAQSLMGGKKKTEPQPFSDKKCVELIMRNW